MLRRMGTIFTLLLTQGLVGWWMVRSGLQEPEGEWDTPRVSPYRLAAHLASAFTIFGALVWTVLDVRQPVPVLRQLAEDVQRFDPLRMASANKLRLPVYLMAALYLGAAATGSFVAGTGAGRMYNTWPTMNGQWFPEEYWDMWAERGWRNFFENCAAVQWNHRLLTASLFTCVAGIAMWVYELKLPMPPRSALSMVWGAMVFQVRTDCVLLYLLTSDAGSDAACRDQPCQCGGPAAGPMAMPLLPPAPWPCCSTAGPEGACLRPGNALMCCVRAAAAAAAGELAPLCVPPSTPER